MAKLTKTQLKSIVKECLVEILSEGLSSSGDVMVEATTKSPPEQTEQLLLLQKETLHWTR